MKKDIETFKKYSGKASEWSAEYLQNIEKYPVRSQAKLGDTLKALPQHPPEQGESMEAIFDDFKKIIPPGLTHWNHPRFHAYFPGNSSIPSMLAEQLMASMGAQCMLWQTSPVATEMEIRMLEWLAKLIGLPRSWKGCLVETASMATFTAIVVAREKALNFQGNSQGLKKSQQLRYYTSPHSHSSVVKAICMAGIGEENLLRIPVQADNSVSAEALEAIIEADKKEGYLPACYLGILGGTGFGANDKLQEILPVAKKHGLYSHIDAAWAGSALLCEEHRHLIEGIEDADSFVFNPHKWLGVQFDCSAYFIKDEKLQVKSCSVQADYLKTEHVGDQVDFSNWSLSLGRRFRALKLWFVLRYYGAEGLRKIIRNHITWAKLAAEKLASHKGFEIVTPLSLSLFTFRYCPETLRPKTLEKENELTKKLLNNINDGGHTYLTQTTVLGKYVIRFQVGSFNATEEQVLSSVAAITAAAEAL